jgi:sulfur-carrier protein
MRMKIRYFAWVRERVGKTDEEIDLPAGIVTVAELMAWLANQGDGYAHVFDNPKAIRAAIDRNHAGPESTITGAKEIAFFPPMTGG